MLAAFDLGSYALAQSDLDLAVITDNASGIAMVPGTDAKFTSPMPPTGEKQASFFIPVNSHLGNNNGVIVEFEFDAVANNLRSIRTINLLNFENQEAGRNSGDPEGIVWMGGTQFALARERVGRIAVFDILPSTTSINRLTDLHDDIVVQVGTQRINGYDDGLGGGDSNDGLEGIAYDRVNETFYVAKEIHWLDADNSNGIEAIYSVSWNSGSSSWVTSPVHINGLFNIVAGNPATPYMANAGNHDISDLFYADNQLFFIKEQGDEFLYRATRTGTNWSMTESRDLTPPIGGEDQIEGLAFDPTGLQMFVVAEQDAFYEFRNSTAPTSTPILQSVTLPTSTGNNVNGQILQVRADVPPGSIVQLIRPNQSSPGSNIVLTSTLAIGRTVAQFSITVDNVERVREMDFTTRIVNSGGAALSASSAIMVPGDFNNDHVLDIDDIESIIDLMYASDFDVRHDLDNDGDVDFEDLHRWIRSLYESFLSDANLDGTVNAADLNALGSNWQGTHKNWSGGDFNGDGISNVTDLNLIGNNWLKSSNKHS